MDDFQIDTDISVIIHAIVYRSIDSVWKEFVETENIAEARIYWRNVFFDALYTIYPSYNLELPKGNSFVEMVSKYV